jgi:hypothetical protein
MYCVRLVLLDAADPGGEPRSRRLQAAATDGHYLRGAADVGARGDRARCRGGAGAGNRRRIGDGRGIGAAPAGREESQAPSKSTAPAARAARAPATAGTAGELRLPAVVRGLSAHVLKTGKVSGLDRRTLSGAIPQGQRQIHAAVCCRVPIPL